MGASVLAALLADAGLARQADGALAMRAVPLAHIAEQVGTPTWVYDAVGIRERFAALVAALGTLPHRICYAVKANSNLAIIRLLAEQGAGADIVSGGEMLRVLAAGVPPARIVFSGVGKSDEELVAAIHAGVGQINVESLAELRRLAVLSEVHDGAIPVGLRINPDVTADTHPYIATGKGGLKFGIPSDQVPEALSIIDASSRLQLQALAAHLGSQILTPAPYRAGVERLLELLQQCRDAGHAPAVLDIGGGLGIRYSSEEPLTPAALFAEIGELLRGSGCIVQLEPGRYLVGAAGVLLTRVLYPKHSGGRDMLVVDAAMNDLIRPALYQAWHEIVPVMEQGRATRPMDVVGPVCETGDFLGRDRDLPLSEAGDFFAVLGAGAYGFVMSSNYNSRARGAEILVDGDRWAVVRPRERLQDLYRDEIAAPFDVTQHTSAAEAT